MITLGEWFELDDDGRSVIVDQLLEQIPAGYIDPRSVGHRELGPLPQFIHQKTNVLFHVVFGGPAVIGMSDRRFERLSRVEIDDDPYAMTPVVTIDEAADVRPARNVIVPTVMVADEVLPYGVLHFKLGIEDSKLLFDTVRTNGVGALVKSLTAMGWRAPSEAEWEYVCRAANDSVDDLAPSSSASKRLAKIGLSLLGFRRELCRDSWHENLELIPERGSNGDGHEVLRGGGHGERFTGFRASSSWTEALWPGRHRQITSDAFTFRPWVDLIT